MGFLLPSYLTPPSPSSPAVPSPNTYMSSFCVERVLIWGSPFFLGAAFFGGAALGTAVSLGGAAFLAAGAALGARFQCQ